ncbi:uncharacterized protein LOC129750967 [Uranotaenia lowii]|uniref:uncharacterized protein LOC129750967 n=1 Tax=Uranotaenia lowii TaxID=190385 RepID=UPI002478AD8A|nr:uncharacterized protein LOC129750967 [Uranotaenia lowii]
MNSQMIGSISEFNSSYDDWNVYSERLEQFFEVNDVAPEKRSAFLISVIGADAYKSLRDLCHPTVPKDKPFEELCELLRKQFSPQVSIFRERAKFYNARQLTHETVIDWYGEIKKLSVDCKFGSNLDAVLLDKFITGLNPGQVLDRLCEEKETLKLEQALDIAINKECATKESGSSPFPICGKKGGIRQEFPKPLICPPGPGPTGYRHPQFGTGFGGKALNQTFGAPAAPVTFGGTPIQTFGAAPAAPLAFGAPAAASASLFAAPQAKFALCAAAPAAEERTICDDGAPETCDRAGEDVLEAKGGLGGAAAAVAKAPRRRQRRRGATRRAAAGGAAGEDASERGSVAGEEQ